VKRTFTFVGVLLAAGGASWGIINPHFTPKHLVEQADVVFAASPQAADTPLEWKLNNPRQIKGEAPGEHVIRLAHCKKDHLKDIQRTFQANGSTPAILFSGTYQEQKQAFMHVAGQWLNLTGGAKGRWDVSGYAPNMSATYAGGTDMLIRMSEYLTSDPDADVPSAAGVAWQAGGPVKVARITGRSGGLAAAEIGKLNNIHLFAASAAGDRLFRPKEVNDETKFEDVTAAAGLDTKSRRFVWVDVDRDGLADLVTWDGSSVSVRRAGADGRFHAPPGKWSVQLYGECTGLAACSTDGSPGVLVSTYSGPLLLVADGQAGWKKQPLPAAGAIHEEIGPVSACIVADLDMDGHVDVLQPGDRGGILWRGKADGFAKPRKTAVAAGPGLAAAAVGDFNEDGALDIFLAGAEKSTLWENDGEGNFKDVSRRSGSVGYKCPPGAGEARAVDLNHDGRTDLCLMYLQSGIVYHFNRGFRALAEEGDVRLPGLYGKPGRPPLGQKAMAVGDFNADGSQDLAVWITNDEVYCYLNEQCHQPVLRLRLAKGMTGPVTVSGWMGEKHPICVGAAAVTAHSPPTCLCARYPGECRIKWRTAAQGEQLRNVKVEDGPVDVLIEPAAGKAGKPG